MRDKKPTALIMTRASSGKQVIEGDTIDAQIEDAKYFISQNNWDWHKKVFELVESATTPDREQFQEVLDFCEAHRNEINFVVFKDISRLTRKGTTDYFILKKGLAEIGIEIRDTTGVIRPVINPFEQYDLDYDWAKYSPSEREEANEAESARAYMRQSIGRMILAEVRYAKKGYWVRSPVYGFKNEKITTTDGIRNIMVEEANEAFYVRLVFQLRAEGQLNDVEISEKLNSIGFRTRRIIRRDKRTKKIIGYGGENKMTPKLLQRMIRRTIYAGIICEKWTKHKPILAAFDGLVDIDTFNKANRGVVELEMLSKNEVAIYYGREKKNSPEKRKRTKNNPEFPYKNSIRCPVCDENSVSKTFSASKSKGKNGRFGYYHCSGKGKKSKHKYYGVPKDTFHQTVYDFLEDVAFDDAFIELFEEVFMAVWRRKNKEAIQESQKANEYVAVLLEKQASIADAFPSARGALQQTLQDRYDAIEQEIKEARHNRKKAEHTETQIKEYLAHAIYFMEHPKELLIDESNVNRQQQLFSLLFDELPTYENLTNRTPKLSVLFKLKSQQNLSKDQMVRQEGFEPPTLCSEDRCSIQLSY
jgi:hypothetical protein